MGGDRVPGPRNDAVDEETRRRREQNERHRGGFDAFDRAQEAYVAEFGRLNKIAVDVYDSDRGSFLKAMADVWCKADPSDKRIIMPAWAAIVVKYGLEEDPEGTGGEG